MGRIDQRAPGRRRAEKAMWCLLYTLILACGGMLVFLGTGGPEKLFASDREQERAIPPAPQHQPAPVPARDTGGRPKADPPSDQAAPDTRGLVSPSPASTEGFFGLPIE